jgi:hypothetical protein
MNASTANQILIYMQIAEMEREKEKKRLRSMSPREIKGERRARRRIKARARQFVDDEAEESEGEVEDPEPAEEGFEEGVGFPRFLNSKGEPFVCLRGRRLVKILSSEYYDLNEWEKRRVKRRERLHNISRFSR